MKTCPRCSRSYPDVARFCTVDGAELTAEITTDPLLGHLVDGRYRLQSELGRGGYGSVYSAIDERVQRSVALKVLAAKLTGQPAEIERFKLEAQTLANLRHPNIVPLFDFGHDPEVGFFICMPLLQGETLASRLCHGPLPILDFYFVARHVARALSAAHQMKIIHRDVKIDNIFLENDNDAPLGYLPKLLDFGLVKVRPLSALAALPAADAAFRYTPPGLVVGTPLLIAPEALEGYDVDARADIYALGGVFYEALTGAEPFAAATTEELITVKLTGSLARPSTQAGAGWIPAELDELITSMMARSREMRPRTVDIALAELERIQTSVEEAWASHHLTSSRGGAGAAGAPGDDDEDTIVAASSPRAAYRVLVAEDDRMQRRLIRAIVEKGGYRCETLDRGDAVLEWLSNHTPPDVMILDILMPGIDGISLLRRLRGWGFDGPVVVVSGLSSDAIRSEVEGLGAVQFVNKSTDLPRLASIVEGHFEAKQRAARPR